MLGVPSSASLRTSRLQAGKGGAQNKVSATGFLVSSRDVGEELSARQSVPAVSVGLPAPDSGEQNSFRDTRRWALRRAERKRTAALSAAEAHW